MGQLVAALSEIGVQQIMSGGIEPHRTPYSGGVRQGLLDLLD